MIVIVDPEEIVPTLQIIDHDIDVFVIRHQAKRNLLHLSFLTHILTALYR